MRMKLIDNVNSHLGDDLKQTLKKGSKLSIAAASFSIYAFEALKRNLLRSKIYDSFLPRLPLLKSISKKIVESSISLIS